jgi:hypothetical protein
MILSSYGAPGEMMFMSPSSQMNVQRLTMLRSISQTAQPTPQVAPTPTPTPVVSTTGASTGSGSGFPDGSGLISNGYGPVHTDPFIGQIQQQPGFFATYWPYLAAGGAVLVGIVAYVALRK